MLQLKNIKKDYKTSNEVVHALKGLSVQFRQNEFVSILGPSGCGKTTLLNIVGGLDNYTSGDLLINGISTKKYKDRDWDKYRNHSVGFVFQNYNLIPHQTVLSNVELALTLSGVSKNERKRKAIKVLKTVGLGDQLNKKPNQMSGGQMQRVAIARALVNDPEILLADEPTGALDSKTSVQIMEILKDISKDRLIIMVTHNPEIAKNYSSRIINLLDGKITSDSNPYEENIKEEETTKKKNKKNSMSFFTALSLSLNNLMTKKGRTILTAFAGSIGIIGIALILSLSNGVQSYINRVEEETLSSYPITIEKQQIDASAFMELMNPTTEDIDFDNDHIYSNDMMVDMISSMTSNVKTNNLELFKKYIDEDKSNLKDYTSSIDYSYNLSLNIYKDSDEVVKLNPSTVFDDIGMSLNTMQQQFMSSDVFVKIFDNDEMNEEMFDIVKGHMPTKYNEVLLVVDENNQVSDYTLYSMGMKDSNELKEMTTKMLNGEAIEKPEQEVYDLDDFIGMKFKFLLNSDYYEKNNGIWLDKSNDEKYVKKLLNNAETIEIVGIIKPSEGSISQNTLGGIVYDKSLEEYVINKVNASSIALEQTKNKEKNVLTGLSFDSDTTLDYNNLSKEQLAYIKTLSTEELAELMNSYSEQAGATYESVLETIGIIDLDKPTSINIYPKDFDSKEEIENIIEEYNENQDDENKISFTDLVGLMMSSISTIINVISYVLMAFVAISLIVSSIMIGIITYISVLERTKEIGILRAMGASKKDISRVFNAETIIEGAAAGILGIQVTALLNIPINIIIKSITDIPSISKLPVVGAIILVIISIVLTFIAGLIPSRYASKKDPVIALRSE